MPTALRYGMACGGTRLRRRSATRSKPSWRAALSTRRSSAKVISGRPELRYGLVGAVLLNTARLRSVAAGMWYGPVMRPEPLESGESDTQRAPTLLTLEERSARK